MGSPPSASKPGLRSSPLVARLWRDVVPSLQTGAAAPHLIAETIECRNHVHEPTGDDRAILLSNPKNFRPACTTELCYPA
jgi:hypothetical protein